MSDRAIGWTFVGVQVVLLVGLVLLPGGDDFTVPTWLRLLADAMFVVGIGIGVVAAISLGRSLTATPVPTEGGSLRIGGLYGHVHHPIYT
ncbi:MAG: methyltransferase family protein, partial [Ilumatobacteraceae bacterium]